MSSSQRSQTFSFVCHPPSPPVFIPLRKLVFFFFLCSRVWQLPSETSCESNCPLQVPVLPQTTGLSVSVCLSVCGNQCVCGTALLYDPAHFPLTFHFLCSHPVRGTTALCVCLLLAFIVLSVSVRVSRFYSQLSCFFFHLTISY